MIRKKLATLAFYASAALLLAGCGADFVMKEGMDFSSVSEQGLSCELNAFKTTYYGFLTKCQGCHVPGGAGSGAFASANVGVAYDAFLLATTTKIDERSVNQNHAPGITGPSNQTVIDTIRPQFQNAVAACSANPTGPITTVEPVLSSAKDIATGQASQTLTWNLATDVPGSSIPGATLSLTVVSATQASGAILYTISNPRLTTTSTGARLQGLMFNFNGVALPLVTTFSRLDKTVASNQANSVLSTAAAAYEAPAPGATPNRIALSFGVLAPQ